MKHLKTPQHLNKALENLNISDVISSDIVKFQERKGFEYDIAIVINGLTIAKLKSRGNGWNIETLDVVKHFWSGGIIEQFNTLDEAKKGAIKRFEKWYNHYL